MLLPNLTANEVRVIGCLMEKSVVTPDQYPLTLNALTNACNQKSSRDPVMSLDQGTVQHTIRALEAKTFVRVEENFKRGVEKYMQRFCNTQLADFQFDSAEFAIICLLLLRGPQTPGELKARSGRLHTFADNADAVAAITGLIDREEGALLVKLPRSPGRKDSEYMHLFCGPVDIEAHAAEVRATKPAGTTERTSVAELVERVSRLETEVAELREKLK